MHINSYKKNILMSGNIYFYLVRYREDLKCFTLAYITICHMYDVMLLVNIKSYF